MLRVGGFGLFALSAPSLMLSLLFQNDIAFLRTLMLAFLVLSAFGLALSLLMIGFGFRSVRHHRGRRIEKQILALAAGQGGRITPTELAMATELNLQESRAALDALVTEGEFELQVAPGGTLLYSVAGFVPAADRALARDPMA